MSNQTSAGDNSGELQKTTDWRGAFMIGLAGTILVTGVAPFAVQSMGAASIPLFFGVTGVGVILCFCLAELAAMLPHRTGGLPSYAYDSFKPLGETVAKHLSGISAWSYGLGWFPVAPINMILAASYIRALLNLSEGTVFTPISAPISSTVAIIAVVALCLLYIPCYRGINLGASFATIFGIVAMVPLTLLIFLPLFQPGTANFSNLTGFALKDPTTGNFQFYMSWIFIMTWSVWAMEAAACYIGECRNPARDAKIAMTAESIYGFFIYLSIPVMLIAVLGTTASYDPLTVFLSYTQAIFGDAVWVQWVIGVPLISALLLSVLNALMGCGRGLFQVAQDGVLPTWFGRLNQNGVPANAMLFNLVVSIIVVFFGSPFEIYIFSNMGYLLSCSLSLVGYFVLRDLQPQLARPVKMVGALRYVALVCGLFFLVVWAYGGYYASDLLVAADKRWLFFLGIGIVLLYFPLYWYRQTEDKKVDTNIFLTFIKPYLSYIDNGHFFRKPFSWLYALLGIVNLLLPVYVFYQANENGIFDAPAKFVIVFLLLWVIIAFAGWVGFQLWWGRKTNIDILSSTGDEFIATPVFSHFIQTFGEWIGTYIGLVGFGFALLTTIILGDEGYYLGRNLGIPYLETGLIAVITMPIIGFLVIVFSRFLSEQIRALSSIANNTRK